MQETKKEAAARKRKTTKIYNETVENMRKVGTFRDEFITTVRRYAELRVQYEKMNDKWHFDGCQITEEYTNKAGAKNVRKTALYLSIETLRKELMEMENILGLTPKGLKAIKTKGLDVKKESALDRALGVFDE